MKTKLTKRQSTRNTRRMTKQRMHLMLDRLSPEFYDDIDGFLRVCLAAQDRRIANKD